MGPHELGPGNDPPASSQGLEALLADLSSLSAKAAQLDPGLDPLMVRDSAVMDATVQVAKAKDLISVVESKLVARLEETDATDIQVGLRTGMWLTQQTERPSRVCQRAAKHSVILHSQFTELADAAAQGHVSWAHVEVVLAVANRRNRDALAAAQGILIDWATGDLAGRFASWERRVRRLAEDLDQDGSYDPNDDVHANRLRLSVLPDDTRELAGRLVGAAGVTVEQALNTIADELLAEFREAHNADPTVEMPTRATLMALALEEMGHRALKVPDGKPARTEAVLIIEEGRDGETMVHTADGTRVPRSAADVLLWDADVRALVVDSDGCPLYLGRKVRLATRDQRLVMNIRDGGCIFPGCDRSARWARAHHEPPWSGGGRTDIDCLGGYCDHHHTVRHRPGWDQRPDPDRPHGWVIVTPTGKVLHTQRNPRE